MFPIKNHPPGPGQLPGPVGATQTRSVVLVVALQAEGFRVHALARADAAVKLLDAPSCPGLILLDLWRPRTGGRELLAAIALRPDRDRFRIILISADHEARALAARPRVVEVLRKPFALEKLLDAVRRYA